MSLVMFIFRINLHVYVEFFYNQRAQQKLNMCALTLYLNTLVYMLVDKKETEPSH